MSIPIFRVFRRFRFPFRSASLFLAFFVLFFVDSLFAQIVVTNLSDGETLAYPLALIEGTTEPEAARILVENLSSASGERILTGQAAGGRFKILAPLAEGENRLVLSTERSRLDFSLFCRPERSGRFVRLICLLDQDTPNPSEREYRRLTGRTATAALLLQTTVAERMNDLGFGRVTFRMEWESVSPPMGTLAPTSETRNLTPKVRLMRADRPTAEYRRMTPTALFDALYRETTVRFPGEEAGNLVVLNFARHQNDALPRFDATTASGGGNLALVGFASFEDWPETLGDVYPALTDESPIAHTLAGAFDESAYRHTRAAAVATTLGATLHELGHLFGLDDADAGADTSVPKLDFMRQGFVHWDRIFLVEEPASALSAERQNVRPEEEPAFFEKNAEILQKTGWLGGGGGIIEN